MAAWSSSRQGVRALRAPGDSMPPNACSHIPHPESRQRHPQARATPAPSAWQAPARAPSSGEFAVRQKSQQAHTWTREVAEDKTALAAGMPACGSTEVVSDCALLEVVSNCALLDLLLAPFCDLLVFVMPPVGKHE